MRLMGEDKEEDVVVKKVLLLNNEPQEEKEKENVTIEEIDESNSSEETEEGMRRRNVHSRVCNKRTDNLSLSESSLNASIPFFAFEASAFASADRFLFAGEIDFPKVTFGFSR